MPLSALRAVNRKIGIEERTDFTRAVQPARLRNLPFQGFKRATVLSGSVFCDKRETCTSTWGVGGKPSIGMNLALKSKKRIYISTHYAMLGDIPEKW
jgi:hypothetical protein